MHLLPLTASILLALILGACDRTDNPPAGVGAPQSPAGTRSPPASPLRTPPDPAMAAPAPAPAPLAPTAAPEPLLVEPQPAGFSVDAAGQRVFLPGEGWISTSRFWEIYYTAPERLPAGIDHHALDAIRPAPD